MEGSFPFCHQKKFHADGLMLDGESDLWLTTELRLNMENINTARAKKKKKLQEVAHKDAFSSTLLVQKTHHRYADCRRNDWISCVHLF